MRVLFYSQVGGMGGSTRLLLNLGRHLADETEVFVALPEVNDSIDRDLRLAYPDLHFINQDLDTLNALKADAALFHLPLSLPAAVDMDVRYKYAVSMEIIESLPVIFTDELVSKFDHLFYLHEEQVQDLSERVQKECCSLMPLINNIDFSLPFKKTKTVAVIGGRRKVSWVQLLRIAASLPYGYRLVNWSADVHDHVNFRWRRLLRYRWLKQYLQYRWLYFRKRPQLLPVEIDVRTMMSQFDALVHVPSFSNGTSTVVSDALQCGKLVFLSNIPGTVRAYSGLPGVIILDKGIRHYSDVLEAYDEDVWLQIKCAYAHVYSRKDALSQWRDAIFEGK